MANRQTIGQDYQSILMQRLGDIQSMGQAQTTWEKIQAQRQAMQRQADEASALMDSQYVGAVNENSNDPFSKFKSAIMGQESSGNYGARNSSTGAMGAYQILPSNLGGQGSGWDYEALGRDITPSQFMASPQLQEQIASFKLKQYYQKYGAAGAAIAWYAGPGTADSYLRSGQISGRNEGAYPSQLSYVQQILQRMGL